MLSRLSLIAIILILTACSNGGDRLDKIKAKGELVVLTRNAATTYYESREGYLGVEYEMAQSFADSIGVKARFVIKENVSDLFNALKEGYGDIAAAGLTHTENREEAFLFGPTYQVVAQQLVCRRGGKRPKKIEDLVGINIKVSANRSEERRVGKEC